ncbi:hypothetical protein H9P43_000366 [Blastocladiella emersonii ATCC 22665]|nr:hypothetical protein H9P43_000366 [Blastocladiella emersonii ATCC 22665]
MTATPTTSSNSPAPAAPATSPALAPAATKPAAKAKPAPIDPFAGLDIRVGRILQVDEFPEARKPALKLQIDLGELGVKKSSAQIVANYGSTAEAREALIGTLVLAVVNLPKRQIGKFMSEVLTLGVPGEDGNVVLVRPDRPDAVVGGKLY